MTILKNYLRRYTDLPVLLYLLKHQCITLVDPASWDDTNDSHYLTIYREKRSLASVLALCFTQVAETYHHWHVFANGASGVCISFHRRELLRAVKSYDGVQAREVTYLKLNEITGKALMVDDLPFLKRYPYEQEHEFRIIYQAKKRKRQTINIPIPLSCIDRITLSPWLHEKLMEPTKDLICSLPECDGLKVVRSTLISNYEWKQAGETAKLRRK